MYIFEIFDEESFARKLKIQIIKKYRRIYFLKNFT